MGWLLKTIIKEVHLTEKPIEIHSPTIVARMIRASTTEVTAMRTNDVTSVVVELVLVPLMVPLQPHATASTHEQLPSYHSEDVGNGGSSGKIRFLSIVN